ncbi:MAG: acyl-ACP--UDP-N-acetylglucosamine O-acyltransferase [Bacteroidales bacterium]|nr:acyl-ACP--UDP-N-acetylglucosamine O-acyltransferase [Bacteroidales bacterium]
MNNIHPGAKLGHGVQVGLYTTIENNVEIGEGTEIGDNVVIKERVRIGRNCKIASHTVIGCDPQDLHYNKEETWVEIGDGNKIFEFVTIARGTAAGRGKTVVGDNCMIMAYTHIAHDCIIGNNVILVSFVALSGFVEIGDFANVGGKTGLHQFCRVGAYSMVAGDILVLKDVPPFTLIGRAPVAFYSLNLIGLRRNGFTRDQIDELEKIYRLIYNSGLNVTDACQKIESVMPATSQRDMVLEFIKSSKRGIIKKVATSLNE